MNDLISTSDEIRISSLEIADLTGKMHKDVMKAIRNMEDTWVKLGQRNFALSSYKSEQNK